MPPIPYDNVFPLTMPQLPPPEPLVHRACQVELSNMFRTRRAQIILRAQLQKRYSFYLEHSRDFLIHAGWFETLGHLHGADDRACYSLRFNHVTELGNLRILFVMDGPRMVLMHAFQEKSDADYVLGLALVERRLKEKET